MKRVLLGAVSLVAIGDPALAADLPARTYVPTKAPAIVSPAYDWSGFYLGVDGGGGWNRNCWSNTSFFGTPVSPSASEGCSTASGGTVGGQVGYAFNNALFYLKGGAAVTDNKYSSWSQVTGIELSTGNDTRWGGAVGVGFEYGIGPNWLVGLEYDHLFMGTDNVAFTGVAPGNLGVNTRNEDISQDIDLITARLNYRFGGPGAARY